MKSWVIVLLTCVSISASLSSGLAQPAQIILIRHAEKPEDKDDPHLSLKGKERAMALVPFLTNSPALARHGLPVALFATRTTQHDRSLRSQETLTPLANALNLPIDTRYRAKEYDALAHDILTDPHYRDKTVLICWVHDYLPELVPALGVKPSPLRWKAGDFDRLWLVQFSGGKASLTDLPQRLLFGDSRF